MQSQRFAGWFAVLVAALQLVPLARVLTLAVAAPGVMPLSGALLILMSASLVSIVLLAVGAWQILRRDQPSRGLKFALAGACVTLISSPISGSVLALVLAIWSAVLLSKQSAASVREGVVPAADTPAIRWLFRLTLATSVVVPAIVGIGVKLMLDRAGKPTLSWVQGVEYSLLLIVPFAAAFVALAVFERRYLRGRLAGSPYWVAHVGVPCWIGALLGAAAGGAYAIWPMMMNVEASIIAVLMPWWFAQWELAGAALGAGIALLLARLGARGSGTAP